MTDTDPLIFINDEQLSDKKEEEQDENVYTVRQEDFRKSHESFDLRKVFEYQNEFRAEQYG